VTAAVIEQDVADDTDRRPPGVEADVVDWNRHAPERRENRLILGVLHGLALIAMVGAATVGATGPAVGAALVLAGPTAVWTWNRTAPRIRTWRANRKNKNEEGNR